MFHQPNNEHILIYCIESIKILKNVKKKCLFLTHKSQRGLNTLECWCSEYDYIIPLATILKKVKMTIKGFGIKNYRSFNEEGVFLNDLSKINIIIGKNNSGKSNILRFLHSLNSNIGDFTKFPSDIQDQYRRNNQPTSMVLEIKGEELPINMQALNRIRDFDIKNFYKSDLRFEYVLNQQSIKKLPDFFNTLDRFQLIPFQNQFSSADEQTLREAIKKNWESYLREKIRTEFSDLIYIPHLRVIKEGHGYGESNSSINGSNIISKMFSMQNPEVGSENEKEKFYLIRSFVRELVNKPDLEIEIPHTKKEIVLTIDNNRLPLESFGTGIHQLVLLCSTLVIHENSIVCIEEPEIHLHPELQRKFINFLRKTKNTYFITTHSNVFLNSEHDTSIYHVTYDGARSVINNANRTVKSISILSDLGYQSSDLLQANGIIWVEGPSDRTYILRWLNLIDPSLIEGLHFVIMFYGGRLLSHLSFQYDNIISQLIPILRINRNAYVIMDRDGFSSKTKINSTKSRISKELGNRNYWITKGREIENYLTSKSLNSWLSPNKIKIDCDVKLEHTVNKVSSIKYNLNKTKYAKEIVEFIGIEDVEILDLKKKLNHLVKQIYSWNNM